MRHNTNQKLENEIKSIKSRLTKQEKTLSELRELMTEIKENGIPSYDTAQSPTFGNSATQSLLSVYNRGANPWTVQTSNTLSAAINAMTNEIQKNAAERSFSTYEKTLKALATSEKGLTATEVGKKTKRSRNTESAYLTRLHIANIIERERIGSKTIYKLRNKEIQKIIEGA